jgi:hypothetical protein
MAKTEVILGKSLVVHDDMPGLNQGDYLHLSKEEKKKLEDLSSTSDLVNDGGGDSPFVEEEAFERAIEKKVEVEVPFTRPNALIRVDAQGVLINQSKVDVTDEGSVNIPVGQKYLVDNVPLESDKSFRYRQINAYTVWNINHNLNKYPSITIKDEDGNEYEAEVKHENENNTTITFSKPFSGYADLN